MKQKSYPLRPTGGEIRDLDQPGYYSGYSTLAQKKKWDEATRQVVTERVEKLPPIRFFSAQEVELLTAIIDRLLPQDDRAEDRLIAILPVIDERLFKNALNGFRYEDMPPDREAYRLGLQAIDEMAQERFHEPFASLTVHRQELILKSLHDRKPDPAHPIWQRMPVRRFWSLLIEDCVTAYYAHPWAWDEIGFGGPAYPRGYIRLEHGMPEPWETDEQRYEWNDPADALSSFNEEGIAPEHSSLGAHGSSH
ncbi:MAG: gluconate 2-dehydrogenase subunit 3 family protein [Terracidiphilus sp.]